MWERAVAALNRLPKMLPDSAAQAAALVCCDKCGAWERALEHAAELVGGPLDPPTSPHLLHRLDWVLR